MVVFDQTQLLAVVMAAVVEFLGQSEARWRLFRVIRFSLVMMVAHAWIQLN